MPFLPRLIQESPNGVLRWHKHGFLPQDNIGPRILLQKESVWRRNLLYRGDLGEHRFLAFILDVEKRENGFGKNININKQPRPWLEMSCGIRILKIRGDCRGDIGFRNFPSVYIQPEIFEVFQSRFIIKTFSWKKGRSICTSLKHVAYELISRAHFRTTEVENLLSE